jgi:hypothetical protein
MLYCDYVGLCLAVDFLLDDNGPQCGRFRLHLVGRRRGSAAMSTAAIGIVCMVRSSRLYYRLCLRDPQ